MIVLDLSASVFEGGVRGDRAQARRARTSAPASSSSRTRRTSSSRRAPRARAPAAAALLPLAPTTGFLPPNPWDRFRAGTRISEGLKVAREALLREGRTGGTLDPALSDLEILPDEVQRLVAVFADLRRDGFDVRIVPLSPRPEQRRLIELLVGGKALLPEPESGEEAVRAPGRGEHRGRPALAVPARRPRARGRARHERELARAARGASVTRRERGALDRCRVRRRSRRARARRARGRRAAHAGLDLGRRQPLPERAASRRRPLERARAPRDARPHPCARRSTTTSRTAGRSRSSRSSGPARPTSSSTPSRRTAGRSSSSTSPRRAARTRVPRAARSSRTSWASSSSRATCTRRPTSASALLTNAIGSFRTAVELDPANDDAKLNLELALRAYGPILFPSNAPDTGGAHGEESGQGRAGSGY